MMTRLPRAVVWHMFLRSFAIQGSWNYRTLQGSGFAYALLPVLRFVYRDDDAALQDAVIRHSALFNAHPYLAGVALGAVARMELDGEPPAMIERFKTALRGSLGTLGDRLVWAGWRPACVLLGLVVLLATSSATAAIIVFLIVYNAGHVALRWWGLHIGVQHGRQVGERLRRAPLGLWHDRVVSAAAFLLGAALPLIAGGALTDIQLPAIWLTLPAGAAVAGWFMAGSVRTPALALLVITSIAGLFFRAAS
ncbi:MAG TPA: PTS system mannose/fructose/sorbose family transporter subunit IID [Longimicrobiales bacterium]|nr:PTS system mannose/fructose/sorbose family transporter subunit IID [Longimicrobiales bacterium]